MEPSLQVVLTPTPTPTPTMSLTLSESWCVSVATDFGAASEVLKFTIRRLNT